MSFGAETTGGRKAGGSKAGQGLPQRFYAWASVIVNGRVVATDYAPDDGWLDSSPDAKPLPKPGGPYALQDPFPVRLSMTLPDSWIDHGGPELTRVGWDGVLQFGLLDNPPDACSETIRPTPGPGLEDLVRYVRSQPYIDITEVRDDTVGGYRAAYLEYRSDDLHCLPAPIPARIHNDTWIVDVGGFPLVIAATSDSPPSEIVRSEVRQIVESIQIAGLSPSFSQSPPPTPAPEPTPRPTPLPPAAGPVPPNPRSWTVTVDNRSSEPATLFVAEEREGGMLRLVGSASPDVVPAGESLKATFLFPADGGWVYVNPRPGEGGALVNENDIGIPGKIVIRANGQAGWLSP
jgi:hypothetical protein